MMDVALEAAAETTENVFAKSQVRFFHLTLGPCSCCSMTFIGFLLSYSGKDEEVAPAILQQDAGDCFTRLVGKQHVKNVVSGVPAALVVIEQYLFACMKI